MNNSAQNLPNPHDSHRSFLLAAFEDTEATIRATDTKASIALVVHGFIFAAMVGVLSNLGDSFLDAGTCFRVLVIVLTGLTLLLFLGSTTQLLRCVMPAPGSTVPELPVFGLFYLSTRASPISGAVKQIPAFSPLKDQIANLTEAEINTELTAELYKVSAIRARKTALARLGFALLGIEVGMSLALLVSLGIYYL
jgi:hypothetical protein